MPSNACHPLAPHKKLRRPDWYVSSLMLERSLDAILRRVRLDRHHDIPYLAGYSQDGKTIYIDRHLPKTFSFGGKEVAVDRYLILHEIVEKSLIDEAALHYLHAHQIATRAEEAAVRADGILWSAYDRFMQRYVKTIGSEQLKRVPADLDLKPYRDEHDRQLLVDMAVAEKNAGVPDHTSLAAIRGMVSVKKSRPLATTVRLARTAAAQPVRPKPRTAAVPKASGRVGRRRRSAR